MRRYTVLVPGLATIVACGVAGSGDEAPTSEAEIAGTAAFALTAACGACAQVAVQGACKQQAEACFNDPTCTAAASCVQACAPGDAVCIKACQQGSPALGALADCVVCNECPNECGGFWPCGGGGGGGGGGQPPAPSCDGLGDCKACVACAATGSCATDVQACLNDPACLQDPTKAKGAFECTVCKECKTSCTDVASKLSKIPGAQCPP
jgi:hypothetical protein